MRALQIVGWKQPPEVREVPDPDPGPGEVVVRIAGAGACHSDLHLLHDFDENLVPWPLPMTLGHENAGWVHALGENVDGLEVGAPVAVYGAWGCGRCPTCRVGIENSCERRFELAAGGPGLGIDGGMAEYLLVPAARHLVPLGDLDPVLAAPLTDAGLTPYHAIKRSRSLLDPGTTAVVLGAGGLGLLACQILRAITPATIVAVDQRPTAATAALEAGAHHAVVNGPSAAADVRALTADRGAELVLDFVGADDTLALAVAVSRSLGHITIVGIAGGTLPVNFFGVPYEVSIATTYWGSRPELAEVIALAAAGHIRPRVERYPLADGAAAYAAMAAGELTGRAVVIPA